MPGREIVEVLKGRPALFFDIRPAAGGTVSLVMEAGEGNWQDLLQDDAAEGKTARQLFSQDLMLVDNWMEFILKLRYSIKHEIYDARDGEIFIRKSLVYLSMVSHWSATELHYNAKTSKAMALFGMPKDAVTKIGVEHLMGIKQHLWLENYMESGGSWEIDMPSGSVFISRALAGILELGQDAVIISKEQFYALVHPEDLPRLRRVFGAVDKHKATVPCRGLLPNGRVLYFHNYAVPGYNKSGRMTRIVGRSQDVTPTEEARAGLALSEQRFRSIVENSQDIFIVFTPAGDINYISPNVTEITGYAPRQVQSMRLKGFTSSWRGLRRLKRDFDNTAKKGRYTRGEYQIRCANGEMSWFSVRLSPILAPAGKVTELVAVCHDVTEERRQAEEMRYMSTHDALTGTFNRYHFEQETERIQREGLVKVGLVMTDLNGLKLVNDAYGNRRGDALLKEAASILGGLCGRRHRLYRIGGDEFAILMFGVGQKDIDELCAAITKACDKTTGQPIPVSISWGTALRTNKKQRMQKLYNQAESDMHSNKLLDSRSMRSHMLGSLKEALRARNLETADHTQRMERMVMAVGRRLGLSGSDADRLTVLASMHDIGKVAIPDHVICKPGKLNDEEWEVMRTHCEIGSRIAATANELSIIADEIACHHERWDGSGYPFGKRGDDIPLLSRIISVVDSYDVMTHKRVYKEAISHTEALEELRRCSGSQFDPHLVELFIEIFGQMSEEELRYATEDPAGEDPPPS